MSSTGRSRHRTRGMGRRTDAWIAQGLMTRDGMDLTPHGERRAEYEAEARAGYWDPPRDDAGPDGYGWADDFYPGGSLV